MVRYPTSSPASAPTPQSFCGRSCSEGLGVTTSFAIRVMGYIQNCAEKSVITSPALKQPRCLFTTSIC